MTITEDEKINAAKKMTKKEKGYDNENCSRTKYYYR
jgi:hypothetical protein